MVVASSGKQSAVPASSPNVYEMNEVTYRILTQTCYCQHNAKLEACAKYSVLSGVILSVFAPQGDELNQWGDIWRGLLHAKYHPIGAGVGCGAPKQKILPTYETLMHHTGTPVARFLRNFHELWGASCRIVSKLQEIRLRGSGVRGFNFRGSGNPQIFSTH